MPELFGMVSKYAPIFLSPPVAGTADAEMAGTLMTAWRKRDGKTYLLVLNTSATPCRGNIDMGNMPGAKTAVSLRDKAVFALRNDKLHDSWEAFQFKIYQVGQ